MFHAKDGLFFARQSNGEVQVISTSDARPPNGANVKSHISLKENEWASVVASVSLYGETSERWMRARLFHGTDVDITGPDWYGVDLDETLAHFEGWGDGSIGAPIAPMVDRVKEWLAEGKIVKIFTARADHGPKEVEKVQAWCLEHISQKLEVTNIKSRGLVELWDDRARQVWPNSGVEAVEGGQP